MPALNTKDSFEGNIYLSLKFCMTCFNDTIRRDRSQKIANDQLIQCNCLVTQVVGISMRFMKWEWRDWNLARCSSSIFSRT
mmetsp:Transcript_15951/g.28492  ORF Transcript_15951/g.28492 Transcript_15951/m.28492 type:complete len:81 (-) Transcript_15951:9-251(-)